MDSPFTASFSSLRHSFPYSHHSLLLWNFPRSLISLVLAFIACLCALTGTMGLPSPSLFCNYAFVFTLFLFPLPIYSHHRLYAPHTVATPPSLVNSLFPLNVSSRFEPCSPLFSHSPPSFCFYRMNPVRAWTLGPSVTCGKSFLKKWKENVLSYSPLTGKGLMHVNFFTLSWFNQVNYIWCDVEHTEITVSVFWPRALKASHVTLYLSVHISAWKSVRRCAAVSPSWWKDSSDVWAPCSTLRTGLWPLLILLSIANPHPLCQHPPTHTHGHLGDLWMVMCKIAFAGLAAGSPWRCTWLRLPATQMQSLSSCSTGSPALTSRWALRAIQSSYSLCRSAKSII